MKIKNNMTCLDCEHINKKKKSKSCPDYIYCNYHRFWQNYKLICNLKAYKKAKECSVCGVTKKLNCFKYIYSIHGYSDICNNCLESDRHARQDNIHIFAKLLYTRQSKNVARNLEKPDYNFKWFKNWLLSQDKFYILRDNWIKNNYARPLTPSVDRINPLFQYKKDNIQLLTLKENMIKGGVDRIKRNKYELFLRENINIKHNLKQEELIKLLIYQDKPFDYIKDKIKELE